MNHTQGEMALLSFILIYVSFNGKTDTLGLFSFFVIILFNVKVCSDITSFQDMTIFF